MPSCNTTTVAVLVFQNRRTIRLLLGERLLAVSASLKMPQKKMTKDYYCAGAKESICISEMILIALFTCICLKDKLGLCSINCHINAITGNCSTSLLVVDAITGNRPLLSGNKSVECYIAS